MSEAKTIAVVCPRFAGGSTVGGAETLLRCLAQRLVKAGKRVVFLTTCARDHFTWTNDIPPGRRTLDGIDVTFFPVDTRDVDGFLRAQGRICSGSRISSEDEKLWLDNSVHSVAMYDHIEKHLSDYDRIITGPYLFGLVNRVAAIAPDTTVLVPCLHDESFARLTAFSTMFNSVRTVMFNTEPERDLAIALYGLPHAHASVVGMGIDPFASDPTAFSRRHGLTTPYVLYSGRREPLKGTPLLLDYLATFRNRTGIDLRLVLTGSGTVEIPDGLRGAVVDLGFVSESEKHEAMAGAVAFCHPSLNESFGIVLLESWMASTPALVHAKSPVLRYQCLKSGGGLWFGSYPEFEEELLLLLNDADLRKRMGQTGRQYVLHNYSWQNIDPLLMAALDR